MLETAYQYIEAFEVGVEYVNDWFGQDYKMLEIYFIKNEQTPEYGSNQYNVDRSGTNGAVWITYDNDPLLFTASHVFMHERIHSLCDVLSEKSNFPRRPEPYPFFWSQLFEEGLATMLEHSYGYAARRLDDVYQYHYTRRRDRIYRGRTGKAR